MKCSLLVALSHGIVRDWLNWAHRKLDWNSSCWTSQWNCCVEMATKLLWPSAVFMAPTNSNFLLSLENVNVNNSQSSHHSSKTWETQQLNVVVDVSLGPSEGTFMRGQVSDRGQGGYLIYRLLWWWQEPSRKWGLIMFFHSFGLYLCILATLHPYFFTLYSFLLSFPIPDLFGNLSLSRPSLLIPSPSSFSPTLNLWLSKSVVSAGGMIPKRGARVNLFLIPTVRTSLLSCLMCFASWLQR